MKSIEVMINELSDSLMMNLWHNDNEVEWNYILKVMIHEYSDSLMITWCFNGNEVELNEAVTCHESTNHVICPIWIRAVLSNESDDDDDLPSKDAPSIKKLMNKSFEEEKQNKKKTKQNRKGNRKYEREERRVG